MIEELASVVLTSDMPERGLAAGDIGTVVMVHDSGHGYTVEFMTLGERPSRWSRSPRTRSGQSGRMRSPTSASSLARPSCLPRQETVLIRPYMTRCLQQSFLGDRRARQGLCMRQVEGSEFLSILWQSGPLLINSAAFRRIW